MMPEKVAPKLTKRTVDALAVDGKDAVFWDRDLKGFGIRVHPSGRKVFVVQTRGPHGPRRATLGRYGNLSPDKARKQAAEVIDRIKRGLEPFPAPVEPELTVAGLAERYMQGHVTVNCGERTQASYRYTIEAHILPELGDLPVSEVDRSRVAKFHYRLRGTPQAANAAVKILSRMFSLAEAWELVPPGRNPCRAVRRYREIRRERFLTPGEYRELGRMLKEADGSARPSAIAALRLLMLTGCRKNEIVGLRWDDVDRAARELRLSDTKTGTRISRATARRSAAASARTSSSRTRTPPETGRESAMAKLGKRSISKHTMEALKVDKDTVFWDSEQPGFGVRVYPTGAKHYIVQTRARGAAKRLDEPTVAELAARYLEEYAEEHCKPNTVRAYRRRAERHIVPALGKLPIGSVRREHVRDLHYAMRATPAMANQTLDLLSRMFNMAESWGLMSEGSNPCRRQTKYREQPREWFLTAAEFRRLGRALDEAEASGAVSVHAAAALRLLMLTECRKNEILTLRWQDVDLEAMEFHLADTKTGARTVSLSPDAVRVLTGIPRAEGNPWVIQGRKKGGRLCFIDRQWCLVRKRAKLKNVRIHDCRHSFATRGSPTASRLIFCSPR